MKGLLVEPTAWLNPEDTWSDQPVYENRARKTPSVKVMIASPSATDPSRADRRQRQQAGQEGSLHQSDRQHPGVENFVSVGRLISEIGVEGIALRGLVVDHRLQRLIEIPYPLGPRTTQAVKTDVVLGDLVNGVVPLINVAR